MPTSDDFRNELYRMMLETMKDGKSFADINAGELHRRVGDYPPDASLLRGYARRTCARCWGCSLGTAAERTGGQLDH
jgi:hypothetical protein